MILWYKNSALASIVSIFGCFFIIMAFAEEEFLWAVPGIPLVILGKIISGNKEFKVWWKQITDANLEPVIASDINVAIQIYNKNPEWRTLNKIKELNPAAAERIKAEKSKK